MICKLAKASDSSTNPCRKENLNWTLIDRQLMETEIVNLQKSKPVLKITMAGLIRHYTQRKSKHKMATTKKVSYHRRELSKILREIARQHRHSISRNQALLVLMRRSSLFILKLYSIQVESKSKMIIKTLSIFSWNMSL